MNLFSLFAKISVDTSEYESKIKDVTSKAKDYGTKIGNGLKKAGEVAVKGIGLISGAATAAVSGLLALENATEEYRIAQGKLNTAFEAAGLGIENASKTYKEFYAILGDTDTATEASQLLAKLTKNEEDLSKWTKIAAGVNGTFGDSLPIEGLIEASNETAKVGTVTGVLADALNWAGISEDDFNKKLAKCTSESERNKLIMETLSDTYDEAADIFYKNNEQLIQSRENQAKLDEALAKLGNTVSVLKNKLLSDFIEPITKVINAFDDLINGVEGAEDSISEALNDMISVIMSKLPEILSLGLNIVKTLANALVSNAPMLIESGIYLIAELINSVISQLPEITEMALDIIISFGTGIKENLNKLQAGENIISQIILKINEKLPQIFSLAVDIIVSLANGIASFLPELIPAAVSMIVQIATTLTDADELERILDAGIEIVKALVEGIIKAIPILVASIPLFVENIEKSITMLKGALEDIGVEIIATIIAGMISKFKDVFYAGYDLMQKIKEGIVEFDPLQLGKDIISTIIQGIEEKFQEKINVLERIANRVKELLGIETSSSSSSNNNNWKVYYGDNPVTYGDNSGTNGTNNTIQVVNNFNGDYSERDGAKIVRSINRKLGLQMV